MRVLVLGASGMLGHAMFRVLSDMGDYEVYGSVRSDSWRKYFPSSVQDRLISGMDANNDHDLIRAFDQARPDVVVNSVGVVKQMERAGDPLTVLPLNALLPHRIAALAHLAGARVVHISTDCVFAGDRGGYTEADTPDARDLYGISKWLGELTEPHCITLRTSIIGHELRSAHSLVDWFLSQRGKVRGYTNAFFSGLPTDELARVVGTYVIPKVQLSGLYQVSANRVAKYDLLRLVQDVYRHEVELEADGALAIDRSLDSTRFQGVTGYQPPEWPILVRNMKSFRDIAFA